MAVELDEPAVSAGNLGLEAEHDRRGAVRAALRHLRERLRADQRRVRVEHEHVALESIQRFARLRDRVGRAELRLLQRDDRVLMDFASGLGDQGCAVSGDDDDLLGRQRRGRGHRMGQHRRAADLVERLGELRIHPGAHARREDHDGRGPMGGFCAGFCSTCHGTALSTGR